MEFFVGLLPAFFWGFTPVLVSKLGGKPINQQLGTSFGCGILSISIEMLLNAIVGVLVFHEWTTAN